MPDDFTECDTCRAKPGTPLLCRSCLINRELISRLRQAAADARAEQREKDAKVADEQAAYNEAQKGDGGWKWREACDDRKAECARIAAAIRGKGQGGE